MAKEKKNEVEVVAQVKESMSVESFILKAIESNTPVETMEKLFGLREKVKAEQAKEAFTKAMARFQANCPVIEKKKIVKDKQGKERYRYAPLDEIVSQVKKVLGDNSLSYKFDTVDEDKFLTVICTVTHELGHSQSSSFKIPIDHEDYMTVSQKYGARVTFAKRYSFCNVLGILTGDEDTDANEDKEKKETLKTDDEYELMMRQAKTLVELHAVWNKLPVVPSEIKAKLTPLKEELKRKLAPKIETFDVNSIKYPENANA